MYYSTMFFFVTALITCGGLLPIYHYSVSQGKNIGKENVDPWTIASSINNQLTMWAVFIANCMIGAFGHVFIYLFENEAKQITERYNSIHKYFLS